MPKIHWLVLALMVVGFGCKKPSDTPVNSDVVKANLPEADMDPAGLQVYRSSETMPSAWRIAIYQKRKFKEMDAGAAKLLAEHSRASLDKLEQLYADLGAVSPDVDPAAQKAVLDDWVSKSSSHVPWLVRGIFELKWAWIARGGGWAKDVPRDGAEMSHQRAELAKSDLLKATVLSANDPYSWAYLISAGTAIGIPHADMEKYFQSAINLDPGNVLAYHNKLIYLLPQWFGSEKEMFDVAEEARNHMGQNPNLGSVWVYAYFQQSWYPRGGVVRLQSPEVWAAVLDWYRQSIAREPGNLRWRLDLSHAAVFMKQHDVALEQFEAIGDRWVTGSFWMTLPAYNKSRAAADHFKAREYQNSGNEAAAETWYRKAIALGYAPSMTSLGWSLLRGDPARKDPAQAIALLRKAAALKDVHAINNLGVAYQHGDGVTLDYAQAFEWYRQAADMGLALAQGNLGWMYREGHGVAIDYEQALKWYKLGAAQGDNASIAGIGWMYENGLGVGKDVGEAKKWYQQAAAAGNRWAIDKLAK